MYALLLLGGLRGPPKPISRRFAPCPCPLLPMRLCGPPGTGTGPFVFVLAIAEEEFCLKSVDGRWDTRGFCCGTAGGGLSWWAKGSCWIGGGEWWGFSGRRGSCDCRGANAVMMAPGEGGRREAEGERGGRVGGEGRTASRTRKWFSERGTRKGFGGYGEERSA